MSILIKGMEMPKNCAECPVNLTACKRGYEYLLAHPELYDQRAEDCPISYVPPHGDLIDRRYAIATACSGRIRTLPTTEDGENWIRVEEVRESIKNAPTIIQASEEGET
ncbi:MAG: hypothetical protein II010_05985 [Oscillospiraceae bacterium]|nr:hypothetical protein [Oscillospiraceae bacterium]